MTRLLRLLFPRTCRRIENEGYEAGVIALGRLTEKQNATSPADIRVMQRGGFQASEQYLSNFSVRSHWKYGEAVG